MDMLEKENHFLWIDILKGIGIISVVLGHVYGYRYVYIYHMPLFFILSGYTFHMDTDWKHFLVKKTRRLILPYISFFFLLFILSLEISYETWLSCCYNFVYGGEKLVGVYGVFWFITVLYLAQIGLNYLLLRGSSYLVYFLLLFVSYICQYNHLQLPEAAQVVPMAIVYMYCGFKLSAYNFNSLKINWKLLLISLVFIVSPLFLDDFWIDMKQTNYGVPIISFILSVLMVVAFAIVAKVMDNIWIVGRLLSLLGQASLVIMYLHQFLHYSFQGQPTYFVLFLSIVIPYACWLLIRQNSVLTVFLLGK